MLDEELESELSKLSAKKAEGIQDLREVLSQAADEKEKRDSENQHVQELKEKRSILQAQVDLLRTETEALEKQANAQPQSSAKGPSMPIGQLRRIIHALEWKQQTEATNAKKEKEISKEIKKYNAQLKDAQKNEVVFSALRNKRNELREKSNELRAVHDAVLQHASQSEKHHERMAALYKQASELRPEISELVAKISERKAVIRERRAEVRESHEKRVQERKDAEQKEKLTAKELAKKIMEDFKAGKAITQEELQILQSAEE